LRKAIADVRKISKSPMLRSTMNVRHKHLAHSLTKTKLEKKRVAPMKYGHDRKLLSKSLLIVEALHRSINRAGFTFANSQKIARSNPEARWKRCTFDIQR
jgi:hypothetical protein